MRGTTSAVAAAVAVARAHGIDCEPVVLREAWHVLVHLTPAPLVARVTSGAPGVNADDVEQELRVVQHIGAGAPVVQPADLLPPGPHRHGGHTVVFWRFLDRVGEVEPAAAGRALRRIHDALADYGGSLPAAGRPAEVRDMLEALPSSADVELLRELAARELPAGQALHGDAHLFNCMQTSGGPVWHDFETACRGPREYDLAALVVGNRSGRPQPDAEVALAAYGDHDAELLERAIPVYAAWVAASFMVAVAPRPHAVPELERRLQFLRRFAS